MLRSFLRASHACACRRTMLPLPLPLVRCRGMATELKDYESHYDRLEVHPECTKTEIREAWLRLSMQYHPDLNPDDEKASQRFMEIKESYTELINDEKRKAYNDKIGFYHSDPPPNYHRSWTLQGEKDRTSASTYQMMWSEERIRELMSAARLREVNWDKQTPAERFRILCEEEKKSAGVKAQLEAMNTPTLREGMERYMLMIMLVALLNVFLVLLSRNERKEEYSRDDLPFIYQNDLVNEKGQVVSRKCLYNIDPDRSMFQDPKKPNKYYMNPMWADDNS